MVLKRWVRDNGKSFYEGTEEEMIEHLKQDPLCVEVPTERPTEFHEWSDNNWIENPVLKNEFDKRQAEIELRSTDKYMVTDSELTEEQLETMRQYRSDLRRISKGEKIEKPEKPIWMLNESQ